MTFDEAIARISELEREKNEITASWRQVLDIGLKQKEEIRTLKQLIARGLERDDDSVSECQKQIAALKTANEKLVDRPKLVAICGSSRFVGHCAVKAWELNKQGVATFFMPCLPEWYPGVQEHHLAEAEGVAASLDALWLRLIDMADEVFVMNINGYIGERTAIEIVHAMNCGKPVKYEIGLPLKQ